MTDNELEISKETRISVVQEKLDIFCKFALTNENKKSETRFKQKQVTCCALFLLFILMSSLRFFYLFCLDFFEQGASIIHYLG